MSLPLIDEDISVNTLQLDKSTLEYDFFKNYLLSILSSLSYCYMELRNYSEAQKCLLEALEVSEESNGMIYYRLAQTRIYNRYSREEDWARAMSDLNKSKRSVDSITWKSREDREFEELIKKELENVKLLVNNYEEETNYRNQSKKKIFFLF